MAIKKTGVSTGNPDIKITPYHPDQEKDILKILSSFYQSPLVKIEMVRESYISRAKLFKTYSVFTGLSKNGELVGAVIGAGAPLKVNEKILETGFGFDLCIAPTWEEKGIEEQLSAILVRNFCEPKNLTRNFIIRPAPGPISEKSLHQSTTYSVRTFTYLVIPTRTRMAPIHFEDRPINFSIDLMDNYNRFPDLVTRYENGICAWHTYKLYSLRISEIHPIARVSTRIISYLRRKTYPKTGDVIRTAILFNLDGNNINSLNQILESQEKQDVNYVNIICSRENPLFNALSRYSIYSYDHCMVTDFHLNPQDQVTVDVRCL